MSKFKLIAKVNGKELCEGDKIPWRNGEATISAIDNANGVYVYIIRENDDTPLPCFANTLNAKWERVKEAATT